MFVSSAQRTARAQPHIPARRRSCISTTPVLHPASGPGLYRTRRSVRSAWSGEVPQLHRATHRNWPGPREALAELRDGDTLMVTKLDRLARSVRDAADIAAEVEERGTTFRRRSYSLPHRPDGQAIVQRAEHGRRARSGPRPPANARRHGGHEGSGADFEEATEVLASIGTPPRRTHEGWRTHDVGSGGAHESFKGYPSIAQCSTRLHAPLGSATRTESNSLISSKAVVHLRASEDPITPT